MGIGEINVLPVGVIHVAQGGAVAVLRMVSRVVIQYERITSERVHMAVGLGKIILENRLAEQKQEQSGGQSPDPGIPTRRNGKRIFRRFKPFGTGSAEMRPF